MILGLLGSGGEGCVYLVRHLLTDALRAVKIYDKSSEVRSIHELNMMKQITHPSLPHIIDVEQSNEGMCLVMEYISGMTLSEYVRRSTVSEEFFICVSEQLLDALEYLHTGHFPVLHLDVKPSNIIICQDGRLVLLDMGAAVPLTGMNEYRRVCRGTIGYAAPEQFDPSGILTERTDLYGFGSTMYYVLHGEKYGGTTGDAGAEASSGLWKRKADRMIFSCLEKEAKKRPSSVREIKEKLRRYKQWKSTRKTALQSMVPFCLLILILCFAWGVSGSRNSAMDIRQKYDDLLEEAELSGGAQAFECYKKAIMLSPERPDVFLHFIHRILSDLVFSLEEEEKLQSLLNFQISYETGSVLEQMQKGGTDFGEFAYQLGLAYWYFYEGSGGRTAAAGWFAKAEKCAQETACTDFWAEEATVYARIGIYYERLGKQKMPGMEEISPVTYWRDLEQLSEMIFRNNRKGKDREAVKESILDEKMNLLIFDAVRFFEAGIQEQILLDDISEMERQGADQMFPGRCEDARDAVRRAYQKQPGLM